jgi:ketosteroid isomerase-like protein
MSEENVEVVRRLFDAVERRDLAGVIASYDENIVVHEASSLLYGGVYHGYGRCAGSRRALCSNLGSLSDRFLTEIGRRISRRR